MGKYAWTLCIPLSDNQVCLDRRLNKNPLCCVVIHHFDNFMNPFTLYRYMNLDDYRAAIMQHCPDANLFFSKFYKMISLPEILGQKVGR
jgi:hypothetical protein